MKDKSREPPTKQAKAENGGAVTTSIPSASQDSGPLSQGAQMPRFSAASSALGITGSAEGRVISHTIVTTQMDGKMKLASELRVSKERVRAALTSKAGSTGAPGERQGSHVTSYETILQLICTVCTDLDVKEVPKKIKDIADKLLTEEEMRKFSESFGKAKEEFEKTIATIPTRDQRKATTAMMREIAANSGNLSAGAISLFKSSLGIDAGTAITEDGAKLGIERHKAALKRTELNIRSEFISACATLLLESINISRNAAFAGDGPEVGEGARVKAANYALKALQRAEEVSKMFSEGAGMSLMDGLEPAQRKKMEEFVADYEKRGSKLKSGLGELSLPKSGNPGDVRFAADDNAEAKARKIITAYRTIEEQAAADRAPRSGATWYPRTFADRIAQQLGNLFDFKYEAHKNDRESLDTLKDVVARHFAIATCAFGLDKLDETVKNKVLDVFLDKVVLGPQVTDEAGGTPKVIANGQGWESFRDDQGDQINKADLKQYILAKLATAKDSAAPAPPPAPALSPQAPSAAPLAGSKTADTSRET